MKAALSLALLGVTSAYAAKASLSDVNRATNVGTVVSNKFIVEVSAATDIPTRELGTPLERLYNHLDERKISFDVQKEFDSPGIFLGAALTLNSAQDVSSLLQAPGVVAITPVKSYPLPKPVVSRTGVSPGDAGIPDSESTHIQTGVDKLHALGITGKGIKVGILDTGVDYTHPFLGGGFGPGFKVAGGFDLVGDAYDGTNTPVPDDDPMDCAGHGTHVSGIVGANPGNEFNISGVAYDATIFMYRIFGCEGSVTDDVIIDGLLMGVKEGVNILSMSLGGADGWTEGAATVVSSRIAAAGTIVTVAAGNDGASGSWFTSGPGNGINVISVASSDNTVLPIQTLDVTGVDHAPIAYFDTLPLPVVGTMPLFAISNDTTVVDDACNPLPPTTPDLTNFVVLVRRGTCTFVTKLANIQAFGGNTTIIYDNGSGFAAIAVGDFNAVLIQADDGVFLAEQLAAGANISVTFPQTGGGVNIDDPTGGLVSTFTSYGPTNDFFFKPAITAPGGSILSTFPVDMGSWALLSGTSMATPFMAGSSALFLAVKGTSAAVAKTALGLFQATAATIPSSKTDGDPLQTVTQQGAGLVQTFDAIFSTTTLSPTQLILNDTAHFAGPQKFTVTNTGKTTQSYTVRHVPAGTATTVDPDTTFVLDGPISLTTEFASVTFNTAKFTLRPGQSQQVVATIKPPKADAATLPVYSGFITVTTGNQTLHATYLGVAASLADMITLDNTDNIFGVTLPALLDSQGNVQNGTVNYTFVGDDAPTLLWRQTFGTPVVRVDLTTANVAFKGSLSSRDGKDDDGPTFSFSHGHGGGTFAKVPILGSLLEVDWLGRNDDVSDLDNTIVVTNTFANGSVIANGSYRLLLRSLRVTGDPTKEEDYDSWLGPIFGVNA